MDYRTYQQRRDAEETIGRTAGWPAPRVEQLYWPDSSDADRDGNVWIVATGDGRYERTDGYYR